MKTKTITIKGIHPYAHSILGAEIEVDILACLPGASVHLTGVGREIRRQGITEQGKLWVSLAGPYATSESGPDKLSDTVSNQLIALIWDLRGHPINPGGRNRPPANWCIVQTGAKELNVFRDALECQDVHEADLANKLHDPGETLAGRGPSPLRVLNRLKGVA